MEELFMEFRSVDDILDYAISKEQEAFDFYTRLSERAERKEISELLKSFAREEIGHKEKLLNVKTEKKLVPSEKKILDLKISDHLKAPQEEATLDYQKALILAMKSEKEAFKLYTELSQAADAPEIKDLFAALAQEEARHKLRFEIEYEDNILKDN